MKSFRRTKQALPERRHVSLAGRTNPYAYHARRSTEPTMLGRQVFREALSTRNARRAARFWTQRVGLLAVMVATVVAIVSVMGLSTDPKVVPLDSSSGVFLHPMSTYEHAAQQLLDGSILNQNKLTVDTQEIGDKLKQQFPELSVVNITLPLIGRRPIIYVVGAQSALLLQASDGHSYVIDTTGRAISMTATGSASSLRLPNVRNPSPVLVHLGQPTIDSKTVAFIETVQYQIEQKGLSASTYVLPAGTEELDMYLNGEPYLVKFNLESNSALQQVGTLLAVKHNLEGRGITPVSYIDVRLDGRAYYK